MLNIVPIFNVLLNLLYIGFFEITVSTCIPARWLPFNDFIRTLILYVLILFFMYTQMGQRCVAFFVRGRNTIGREEKILQPIIEQLKDRTDIRGYSAPVYLQFRILEALNEITGKNIKSLDRKINRMKYEYLTGTVKIFSFDSLDIESNSYGNSIFISKGALDTLTSGELRAVIYNEFAQIKTNVANMRLLHDGSILLGRGSAIGTLILAPFSFFIGLATNATFNISYGSTLSGFFGRFGIVLICCIMCFVRLILWKHTKKYTNVLYMLYERKIFIKADRATHKAGFSADMLSYLEKLYVFKLGDKDVSKLFVELRPLVAYRINYFDNVLGRNRELSADNYAWSSNYMERVQTVNNNKNIA